MCAWRVDQMVFFKNKDKFSIFQRQQETKFFELVMDEIASDKRHKGIWGQAIVKANGDKNKAEAEYIRLRVESLKDELEVIKQNEHEEAVIKEEINKKYSEKEKQKQDKPKNKEFKFIFILLIVVTLASIVSINPV